MNKEIAEKFLKSIEHEQQQDIETTAQLLKSLPLNKLVSLGLAVNHLQLENVRTGLGGKLYLELCSNPAIDKDLNKGDLKSGDVVSINANSKGKYGTTEFSMDGVVYKCSDKQIVIIIDETKEETAIMLYSFSNIYLLKTTNTITYKRMESTMRRLAEFEQIPKGSIIEYLLCIKDFVKIESKLDLKFNNPHLNDSQKEAIKFSLQNDISIIHGPPGTGKTFTLIELVKQLYDRNERILICGPSNASVDIILERLSKIIPHNEFLRIGHPARLSPLTLSHSLDILSKSGDVGAISNDIKKEIDEIILKLKKMKGYKNRKDAWKEIKGLKKELRKREEKVIKDLILGSRIVVSTLHGSSSQELCHVYEYTDHLFDTLIIDEVSQSLEPQCWIPLMSHLRSSIKRLVLAGDDKQLHPTIKTENNYLVKKTLSTTIFERLVNHYGDAFLNFLDVQYRMNQNIMEFPSQQMYGGKLFAAKSVATQTLSELNNVDSNDETTVPLIWYDTQGDDFLEKTSEYEKNNDTNNMLFSRFNENEGYLILHYISRLIESNISQNYIGIITPYNAQVSFLKKLIHIKYPQIEISTIDGFQGREKECIVLSLVRSNDKFEIGFLKDERRLNVAMTRAKRQLCVVGNMEILERSNVIFLKNWASWSEQYSEVRYPDINDFL